MAGTDPGFDSKGFRDSIHQVMNLGLPNATADRATFRWTTKNTYAIEDPVKRPYDWTEGTATTVVKADVQVPCVVEFQERGPDGTAAGSFDASKAIVVLLDVDYALVAGADQILIKQNVYDVNLVAPPIGLFDVTIYSIYCTARDAT